MTKITFKRIDNGYLCKPSYKCSNGMIIEAEDGKDMWDNRYYIGTKGFSTLKDAKEYCLTKNKELINVDIKNI